jgi:hypothetical protein
MIYRIRGSHSGRDEIPVEAFSWLLSISPESIFFNREVVFSQTGE